MADHRVRLNDRELALVVASLRARSAGVATSMALECLNLAQRLAEGGTGNPEWRLPPITATHTRKIARTLPTVTAPTEEAIERSQGLMPSG